MSALTFTIEVDHTDRNRADDGHFVTYTSVVSVLADTDTEAALIAAQIVASLRHDIGAMVTTTRVVSCIA